MTLGNYYTRQIDRLQVTSDQSVHIKITNGSGESTRWMTVPKKVLMDLRSSVAELED